MANINLSTGVVPATQIPLDSKVFVKTLLVLASLGLDDNLAYKYYEKMKVFCAENEKEYIWREELSPGETDGVLETSFTYPAAAIADGVDYSGRVFNFFEVLAKGTCVAWGNTFTHRKANGKGGDGIIELNDIATNGLTEDLNTLIKTMVYMNTLTDNDINNPLNWNILSTE
jgi:hypothetical protein